MKIAITGASGFIGSHLSDVLQREGHIVLPIDKEIFEKKQSDVLALILESCQVVINLAGAPINHKWTPEYKAIMFTSRIDTTRMLVDVINSLQTPPQLLISTSAVGFYTSLGCVEEGGDKADTFLADLCEAWENEARQVTPKCRLAITRFGIVLSSDGGALPHMLMTTKFGITTQLGENDHYISWIALTDLINAIKFIIDHKNLSGEINLVAPTRTSVYSFYSKIAEHFHSLATIPIPNSFLEFLKGESAEVITTGQCVAPKKLLDNGFTFIYPSIGDYFDHSYSKS